MELKGDHSSPLARRLLSSSLSGALQFGHEWFEHQTREMHGLVSRTKQALIAC